MINVINFRDQKNIQKSPCLQESQSSSKKIVANYVNNRINGTSKAKKK